MSVSLRRRAAVAAVLALVATALVILSPTAAQAATTTTTPVTYSCATAAFGVEFYDEDTVYEVTFTGPTTATNGSTYTLAWSLDAFPSTYFPINGISIKSTLSLGIERPGHAPTQVSVVSTPSTPTNIVEGQQYPGKKSASVAYRMLTDSAGQVIKFVPGVFSLEVVDGDNGFYGAVITCTPIDSPEKVLRSVTVNGAPPACVATNNCNGSQTFVGTVSPNKLTAYFTPAPGWVPVYDVGTLASDTTSATSAPVDTKFARVADTRTGDYGWSLTADYDGVLRGGVSGDIGGGKITVSDLSCDETAGASGSAPSDPGGGGNIATPKVLCSVDQGALGNTGGHGGQWDVLGKMTLSVPAYARAGVYAAVVTVTLS